MIQLYWKNATENAIGPEHGISALELDQAGQAVQSAHRAVCQQISAGKLGYAALPTRRDYRDQVMKVVEQHRGKTSDVVVLGIGGSALGNIALQNALNSATYNYTSGKKNGLPRLWVLDNAEPALIADTLKLLGRRLSETVFNVVSKSGETAETAAQFMIVRELLRKKLGDGYAHRIVATTDANKGTLHDIALKEGYSMLVVPDDVGGRFSVLTPVGLFSAAMTGIDIDALLAGAAEMKQHVETAAWKSNPACVLALITWVMTVSKRKPIHVMMPYSNRLYSLADWFRQLWAESLGKQTSRSGQEVFAGATPIKALGATDQHSQVQLYREGPNDKLIVFLEVAEHPNDIRVPDVFGDVPGLAYLRKARISKLLSAEKRATEYALAVSKRPSVTIRFDEISPQTVGQFLYLWEFTTSLMGELLDINAYDQPAVELGKKATFALMKREGYRDVDREIARFDRTDPEYLA